MRLPPVSGHAADPVAEARQRLQAALQSAARRSSTLGRGVGSAAARPALDADGLAADAVDAEQVVEHRAEKRRQPDEADPADRPSAGPPWS